LIAALCLAHIAGPEARLNSQLVSGARSRDQAALVFDLMVKMINLSPELSARTRYVPSGKRIYGLSKNVEYQALAAEASTKHGLSPWLVIFDELGQVKGPKDAFVEALETAQGAYDDAMQIVISTQAPTDADLLSIWIDDALKSGDPHTVIELHTAPENDKNGEPVSLLDKKSWKLANPALGTFRSKIEMAAMAEKAERMPSFESSFRNLYLNQRIDRETPFISKNVWASNGGAVSADWANVEVYSGLDLSAVHDLTAHVPIAKIADSWEIKPTFWLPSEGLRQKSKDDRVPWDDWAKAGFLNTTPGKTVDYEWVAHQLYQFELAHNWKKCAFDRWAFNHLKPWLIKAGFSEARLADLFVEFGQGFASMSPAMRDTEQVLLEGKAKHGGHPILTMCAQNAVVSMDPAGGRKLNKAKSNGRIDGMVSLVMAFGTAPLQTAGKVNHLAMIV
jgi:phage terminase large subunit-like protein